MYYDNGAMPTPNRPQPPMPGFTPSGNAMPTGIVAGKLPHPKMQSVYQPARSGMMNRPGSMNPPQMYGQQQGYGQQQMYGRRPLLLRSQNQMGLPQQQGMGRSGMYGNPQMNGNQGWWPYQNPGGMALYGMQQQQPTYQTQFSPSYAR